MKNRREKIILAVATIFLSAGIITYKFRNELIGSLEKNPYLARIYRHNQSIKVTKEIFRKIHDEQLKEIIQKLSLEKQEIVNEILFNSIISDALNNSNPHSFKAPKQTDDISYSEVLKTVTLCKGLDDLATLSPELKNYLDNRFPMLHYHEVAQRGERLPDIIKAKQKLLKVILNPELKTIVQNFTLEQIETLDHLIAGDADINYFLENFKIENLEGPLPLKRFSENLDYPTMQRVSELAQKIISIKSLSPYLKAFIEKNSTDFEYSDIQKYGPLYLSDIKNEIEMKKEYMERTYTFEDPYIKLDPYARTPLAGIVKFKEEPEADFISVNVIGKKNLIPLNYTLPNDRNEIPIVGLYPREENTITLTLLDKNKTPLKKTLFKLVTPALNDKLPVVITEKKFALSMEPGMNLVSYNVGNESMPFIFDGSGNIRYILSPTEAMGNIILERDKNGNWLGYGEDKSFNMDILGKILSIQPIAKNPFEVQKLQDGIILSNTQYLMKMNNYLTVFGYSDKSYPSALFQEIGCDSKEELFRARIYYDKNSFNDNNIMRGERIPLIPNFNLKERGDNNGAK